MSTPASSPARVLFLCSGNYYRSRFAEMLFNALAREENLNWVADSGGLVVDQVNGNVGPCSRATIAALRLKQIEDAGIHRMPVQVDPKAMEEANLVIAVKELEHRPMLAKRLPGWEDRVEYWHVHDLDQATVEEALAELEEKVRELVTRLSEEQRTGVSGK
jgi:protein-tyrosine-phosphatase